MLLILPHSDSHKKVFECLTPKIRCIAIRILQFFAKIDEAIIPEALVHSSEIIF